MPVVAQVSDFHLSPRVPARQVQAELVLSAINAAKPDLVVITGDLTDDGWERPEDLVWAKRWIEERIEGDWFAVPGNHDVGNFAGAKEGAITANRVEAWVQVFGSHSHFQFDYYFVKNPKISGWEIAGFNSMLFGSGLPQEQAQHDWLNDDTARWKEMDVAVAVMLHSPFFFEQPEESPQLAANYWLGPARARQAFLHQLDNPCVKLIASGHVHQTMLDKIGDTQIIWAPPASGTWVHAPALPNPPAPQQTGFVLHHLGDDGAVRSEIIECAPMLKTVAFDPSAE